VSRSFLVNPGRGCLQTLSGKQFCTPQISRRRIRVSRRARRNRQASSQTRSLEPIAREARTVAEASGQAEHVSKSVYERVLRTAPDTGGVNFSSASADYLLMFAGDDKVDWLALALARGEIPAEYNDLISTMSDADFERLWQTFKSLRTLPPSNGVCAS
jgi:hypothetical protein